MAPKFPLENPTTHFFKIITLHDHEGKLMIPRAFVEKYGEGLPKTVFVKPPNGAEWKLDLVKSDGEIWFQKGWKEFAEHHSLAHGHLLLFRYGGTSHFQLRIFAMNALEINYPVKTVECKRASDAKGKKPANNENSEDYKEGRKRKANLSLEVLQPCKMETGGCVKAGSAFKFRKTASPHTDKMCKGKQVITAKQVTALERASSFKICNPSFLIFMHPSYIRGYMNLPPEFCLRHLDLSKPQGVFNLLLNGRVWTAGYVIWKTKIALSSRWRAFVTDNKLKVGDVCTFELIAKTNNTFQVHIFRESDNASCSTSQVSDLRAGQKREANLLSESLRPCKVGRSRCARVGNSLKLQKGASSSTDKKCLGKEGITAKQVTALDRARSFKICNPSFLIFMYPSYIIHGQLNLPSNFCLRHLDLRKPRGFINLEMLNGTVSTVKYLIKKSNTQKKIVLGRGWKAFVKDNNLKVGDVCSFELIAKTCNTFQVHIFRESDNANCPTSQVSDIRGGIKRKANLSSESLQPCKVGRSICAKVGHSLKLQKGASSSTDKKCQACKLMMKCVAYKDLTFQEKKGLQPNTLQLLTEQALSKFNLPSSFCLRHLDLSKPRGFINLGVLNGRVSTVKYLIKKNYTRKKVVLGSGWREFVKDNNLKVGDVCSFELIAKTNNTFQVHIFRESDNANCPTSQVSDLRVGIKRKANLSSESLQPCKVGRSRCAKVGNSLKLKKGASFSTDKRCQGKQVIAAKQVTALDRASSFKTCNPSFLIFMRPTYVTRGEMNLPARFCLQHLDLSKLKGDINLGVVNGRVWTVKYLIRKSKRRVKIVLPSRGWRVFVKDNNLKVGDVCTFELIVSTNNTFLVHIFRESDNANSPTSQESVKVEELVKD